MATIDVLICAHNEAVHIGRTLESLERQTVGAAKFRVIVIDNASNDDTLAVVKSHSAQLNLVCIAEPRLGIIYAWHTAYAISQADYIAHLDADTQAHPKWLETIGQVLGNVQPELCGGPYYPYYVDTKPYWFLDRYNTAYLGDRARFLSQNEYLNGTNMIWRRSLVQALGGFTTSVGLAGRGLARGDETELIVRARATQPNFRVYYDPDIIVYHLTRSDMYSFTYWMKRYFVQGRRQASVFGRDNSAPRARGIRKSLRAVRASARIVTRFALGLLWRDRQTYPFFENHVYERVLPEFVAIGELFGD